MNILSVETTSHIASVAVHENDLLISKEISDGSIRHAETILPMIHSALNKADINIKDIDLIAVDIGPGSFTGVRIGVSIANALAYSNSIPILGIYSLDALRYASPSDHYVCPLIDAKNDNSYGCLFKGDTLILDMGIWNTEEIVSRCPEETIYIGDVTPLCIDITYPDAEMLGRYAFIHHNKSTNRVMPCYFRQSQAERNKMEVNNDR